MTFCAASCAVSSCRNGAARHGQRGHAEYAAGTGRTFPVGIPSRQQRVSAKSQCGRSFRYSRKSSSIESAAQYQSAGRCRRKIVSQQQCTGADGTERIRAAAQYLCADSEFGRRAASGGTSDFSYLFAIRYGRKSVRAAQRRTVNICTKRYGRKTASFPFGRCLPFCTVPRYRRN